MPYPNSAEAIAKAKDALARDMKEALSSVLSLMWISLIKKRSKKEFQAELPKKVDLKVTAADGKGYEPALKASSVKEYGRLKAKHDAMGIAKGDADSTYRFLKKEREWQRMQGEAYAAANAYEERAKARYLGSLSVQADPKAPWKDRQCFAICSRHADCAEDHIPYQGRLYYDRFWRRNFKEPEARDAIEAFIKRHGLMSWQKAINRPAWLITRPNCRHWLKPITVGEAFSSNGDADSLLRAYGMETDIGERGTLQTIKHPINEGWYTTENVKGIILRYQEREKTLLKMQAEAGCTQMSADLRKTRLLIAKWKGYLKKIP